MNQPDTTPVILYGSVRAGTTMFRLMLGAHPDLVEIGENRYLVDCLRADGRGEPAYDIAQLEADRVFRMRELTLAGDLNGPNLVTSIISQLTQGRDGPAVLTFHADIATVEHLFPEARFIHICRDPRDVAKSVTGFGWSGNVYYGADFWLDSEASWEAFIATADPNRYIEVRYEDLVAQPKDHLERVCAFLGLDFDDAMLQYSETSTYSKPDPKLLQRWRTSLTPRQIALVEERCGNLMEKRGYSREYVSKQQIGSLQRAFLAVDNKVRKAASTIKFFGLRDYSLEKIYRVLLFRGRHATVERRMQAKVNQSLK